MNRIRVQALRAGLPPRLATLGDLDAAMTRGSITADSLTRECLAAIAAHDRQGACLAAIMSIDRRAVDDALRLDAEAAAGRRRGMLHGMPIAMKDNIDIAGQPTTSGNRAMAFALATRDAPLTSRLRRAGAILLAKTHMSEFSFEIRSRSSLGGDVRNPFNPTVTAGGSSGGAAAAVAAGFAVAGLGTDTGGSIRIPAAFNGLVGLRPTRGLLDMTGVAPLAPTTDTIGPIARSVDDVTAIMAALSERPRESWLPEPASRRSLRSARLGVLRQAFGRDQDIVRVMETALAAMGDAGASLIDPVELPADSLPNGRPHVVDWEFGLAFDHYLRGNFGAGTAPASLAEIYRSGDFLADYSATLLRRLEVRSLDAPIYRQILAYHSRLRSLLSDLMTHYEVDALVYPTSAVTPQSLDNPDSGWAAELAACAGWPALTVPAGTAANGVPVGLEFLGRAHTEPLLLGLARDFEAHRGGRPLPAFVAGVID